MDRGKERRRDRKEGGEKEEKRGIRRKDKKKIIPFVLKVVDCSALRGTKKLITY